MEEIGILLFIGVIIGGLSSAAGCSVGRQSMKVEAVREGVAHWLVVDESGKSEFFWIQCDCDECDCKEWKGPEHSSTSGETHKGEPPR